MPRKVLKKIQKIIKLAKIWGLNLKCQKIDKNNKKNMPRKCKKIKSNFEKLQNKIWNPKKCQKMEEKKSAYTNMRKLKKNSNK